MIGLTFTLVSSRVDCSRHRLTCAWIRAEGAMASLQTLTASVSGTDNERSVCKKRNSRSGKTTWSYLIYLGRDATRKAKT